MKTIYETKDITVRVEEVEGNKFLHTDVRFWSPDVKREGLLVLDKLLDNTYFCVSDNQKLDKFITGLDRFQLITIILEDGCRQNVYQWKGVNNG